MVSPAAITEIFHLAADAATVLGGAVTIADFVKKQWQERHAHPQTEASHEHHPQKHRHVKVKSTKNRVSSGGGMQLAFA